jgi:hypothetical protein
MGYPLFVLRACVGRRQWLAMEASPKDVRLEFQVVQPPLDHVADADDAGQLAVAEALWLKRAPFPCPRQRSSGVPVMRKRRPPVEAISFFVQVPPVISAQPKMTSGRRDEH